MGAVVNDVDPLLAPVYASGEYKPFAEFTLAEVQARARELRAASGPGTTARVAPVARAWSELAAAMSESGAQTVAELPPETARELARRAWVVLPSPR
jgi:hypothetical protein